MKSYYVYNVQLVILVVNIFKNGNSFFAIHINKIRKYWSIFQWNGPYSKDWNHLNFKIIKTVEYQLQLFIFKYFFYKA